MCRTFSAGLWSFVLLLVACGGPATAFVLQDPQLNAWGIFGPTDVAAGPNSLLYVSDPFNRAVQVFDLDGRFRFSFSATEAPGETLVGFPDQLAVNSEGNVYATQPSASMIRTFSPDGDFLFGTDGGGRIERVGQIAVGANDQLFVLDRLADVVHVLDAHGTWLRAIGGTPGGSTLGVADPLALATDLEGRLHISGSNRTVAVLDPSGNHLANIVLEDVGSRIAPLLAISDGHIYTGGSDAGVIDRHTLNGDFVDRAYGFPRIHGMGVGAEGELYTAHQWARSVDRVAPEDFASRRVGTTRLFDRPNASGILDILDRTGIGRTNRSAETTAETFIVPGDPGEIVELTFSYFYKGGSQRPRLGVFDRRLVTADPIQQPVEFAIQALEARLLEFTKPPSPPPSPDSLPIGTINVAAGTELGFFMFPDAYPTVTAIAILQRELESFGANDAYERLQDRGGVSSGWFPFFSIAGVNYGRVDQFVTFFGEDFTVVAAEDTRIRWGGDVDLTDMVIKINARLIPVPEPAGGVLAIMAAAALSLTQRLRR